MAKNTIGYSVLTDRVYLGKVNEKKSEWVGEKTDITTEFISCAFGYFGEGTTRKISGNGKNHMFAVMPCDKASIMRMVAHLEKLAEEYK